MTNNQTRHLIKDIWLLELVIDWKGLIGLLIKSMRRIKLKKLNLPSSLNLSHAKILGLNLLYLGLKPNKILEKILAWLVYQMIRWMLRVSHGSHLRLTSQKDLKRQLSESKKSRRKRNNWMKRLERALLESASIKISWIM